MRRPCRLDSVTPSAARRTGRYTRTVRQNDRENEDSCNNLSSAWRAVLVFLIGRREPAPLPATVARRASVGRRRGDRKSTRLNSSHLVISYAVFCLKKKK